MKNRHRKLRLEDREKIAILRAQGLKIREIARELGWAHSTIVRELNRNGAPINAYYLPSKADERARIRKRQAGYRYKLKSDKIRDYVTAKLRLGWSPEQISGRIKREMPGQRISHEAIYQWIYTEARYLIGYLPRRHRMRYS